MRRPGADLEEKPEPRVALLAEAQNGDGMKQSGRGLTRAAIEKPTFVASSRDWGRLVSGHSGGPPVPDQPAKHKTNPRQQVFLPEIYKRLGG